MPISSSKLVVIRPTKEGSRGVEEPIRQTLSALGSYHSSSTPNLQNSPKLFDELDKNGRWGNRKDPNERALVTHPARLGEGRRIIISPLRKRPSSNKHMSQNSSSSLALPRNQRLPSSQVYRSIGHPSRVSPSLISSQQQRRSSSSNQQKPGISNLMNNN